MKDKELTPQEKFILDSGSRARILDLFLRMYTGESVDTEWAAKYFNVKPRAIQRDYEIIKNVLEKYLPNKVMVLNREDRTRSLDIDEGVPVSGVIAVLKMIIGTRAFSKEELEDFKEDILSLVSYKERPMVKTLLAATLSKYYPVDVPDDLLMRIDKFSEWIVKRKPIHFEYRNGYPGKVSEFKGVPINLYFDTSFYYVMIYIVDKENLSENPLVFRVDRFVFPVKELRKSYNIPFDKKVDEGVVINKMFLLKMGNDVHYRFQYWSNPQTALNKLPGSEIEKSMPDGSVIIKGEIFSEGALLWIFSQGDQIKVLGPRSLKIMVKERLRKTLELYK
ncbi:WYL domain-containing protein [Companilactobacillus suantsaicola]|uniref:WYL domain-containing protein n=1 Tax=Companilactobacillus suantsaicola TaxID=2487723 RepID=A0A4Z0JKR1_9LACO|nr:WYL domain-containing protein [Companilactobacillus suantsaicola]TGD23656.1 WYL domain-containing protein [Companilactobacillus suantsaicola]